MSKQYDGMSRRNFFGVAAATSLGLALLGAVAVAQNTGKPIAPGANEPEPTNPELAPAAVTTRPAAAGAVDEEAMFFRKTLFTLGDRNIILELNENPQPFLDWRLVETGYIGYLGSKGDRVPLSDPHDYTDERQIHAVPFSVASGVRIRTQPATKGEKMEALLKPDTPWEGGKVDVISLIEDDGAYRLWYRCEGGLAMAESKDLINWTKPMSKVNSFQGHSTNLTNYVRMVDGKSRDWANTRDINAGEGSIFKDPSARPEERYKGVFHGRMTPEELMAAVKKAGKKLSPAAEYKKNRAVFGAVSPDGMNWKMIPDPILFHFSDTPTVVLFDPQINKYIGYFRIFEFGRRSIGRSVTDNFASWDLPTTVLAPGPDEEPFVDFYTNACRFYPGQPDLRVIFTMAYNRAIDESSVRLASSRDGALWHWVPGGPILRTGAEGEPDAGLISVTPSFVRSKDGRMVVVYGGSNLPHKFPRYRFVKGIDAMAWWKEDRLTALEAEGRGEFTTVFLRLVGSRLLLNFSTERTGEIQVEVLDENFKPVPGRTFADADPLFGDDIARPASWRGETDLSALNGKIIYLRFKMRAAKLYAIKAGK